jgi:hypothetical protein
MKKYRLYDIEWETDDEEINLPREVTLSLVLTSDESAEERCAEELADRYGWLVKGFKMDESDACDHCGRNVTTRDNGKGGRICQDCEEAFR